VQIRWSARSCFAQLQDVGPCGEDDFEFVFGNAALPSNAFGAKAGLDVSPAVRRYLGMNHNNLTYWRFADESDVLEGPWMEIVTTPGNNREVCYWHKADVQTALTNVPEPPQAHVILNRECAPSIVSEPTSVIGTKRTCKPR
jgi:hypothetical protein